jgi:hypothetical protein
MQRAAGRRPRAAARSISGLECRKLRTKAAGAPPGTRLQAVACHTGCAASLKLARDAGPPSAAQDRGTGRDTASRLGPPVQAAQAFWKRGTAAPDPDSAEQVSGATRRACFAAPGQPNRAEPDRAQPDPRHLNGAGRPPQRGWLPAQPVLRGVLVAAGAHTGLCGRACLFARSLRRTHTGRRPHRRPLAPELCARPCSRTQRHGPMQPTHACERCSLQHHAAQPHATDQPALTTKRTAFDGCRNWPAQGGPPTWPRYFTLAGVVAAFLSTFFAHGFLRLSRQVRRRSKRQRQQHAGRAPLLPRKAPAPLPAQPRPLQPQGPRTGLLYRVVALEHLTAGHSQCRCSGCPQLLKGGVVAASWLSANLLNCNVLNIAGALRASDRAACCHQRRNRGSSAALAAA